VFKGENTITGECVALKKINIASFTEGVPSTAMREIAILTEIEDKNVVELKEVVLTDTLFFLVQEFCNMDLRAFLQMQGEVELLSAATIKSLMY
jgi:serine/threonine protein kinase